jgi:hypothetical protein
LIDCLESNPIIHSNAVFSPAIPFTVCSRFPCRQSPNF